MRREGEGAEVHTEGKRGWGAITVRQEEVPGGRSLRVLYIALCIMHVCNVLYIALYTELCGVPAHL